MGRRLIKDKEGSAVGVSMFKDIDCMFDLHNQLLSIPPFVALGSRIDHLVGFIDEISIFAMQHQVACNWIDQL